VAAHRAAELTRVRRLLLILVRAYQLLLSPLLGGHCRYYPSCSCYAHEAIGRHGAARGAWLAVRRLARCHPFATGGYDPVPECGAHPTGSRAPSIRELLRHG
jgi:putative membrane protein insertion efficiency factor